MHPERRPLIVGLGNELLRDDGVGVHLLRRCLRTPPPGVDLLEAGTSILWCLPELERRPAILFLDAMMCGGRPGSVYAAAARDLEGGDRPASLHQVNLAHLAAMVPSDVDLDTWSVIGVEPGAIEYSMELSPTVRTALDEAERFVRAWAVDPSRRLNQLGHEVSA